MEEIKKYINITVEAIKREPLLFSGSVVFGIIIGLAM